MNQQLRKRLKTESIAAAFAILEKLVRLEPTCIKCGCQEYSPCDEGCSWTFLNKKTNEGLCSACFVTLALKQR